MEGVNRIHYRRKSWQSRPGKYDFYKYPIIQYVISSLSYIISLVMHVGPTFSSDNFVRTTPLLKAKQNLPLPVLHATMISFLWIQYDLVLRPLGGKKFFYLLITLFSILTIYWNYFFHKHYFSKIKWKVWSFTVCLCFVFIFYLSMSCLGNRSSWESILPMLMLMLLFQVVSPAIMVTLSLSLYHGFFLSGAHSICSIHPPRVWTE